MSSTQTSYPRSPLPDAFSSLLNNSSSARPKVDSLGMSAAASSPEQYPVKSSSSTLQPPSSEAAPVTRPFAQRNPRPLSEVIRPESYISPETEALDKWFEDLQEYEQNLESMASASLDTRFKDELQHVDQWFSYLNEAERTATVYSLLQHSNQVQIRFFITVLQQMGKKDPVGSLLSPAHPEKSDMQAQLAGAMAKAELEASQKLLSVLPYRTGHSAAAVAAAARNADRHSFALGEADEHRLLSSLGPDFLAGQRTSASSFGMVEDPFVRSRLKPQARTPVFNNSARPRSVIEGDLSSIFSNGGWSSFSSASGGRSKQQQQQQPSGGMVGMDPHRTSTGRPKSADISNWSFGLSGDHPPGPSPWGGLSPTMSTFSEHAKTIERPSSASDIDQLAIMNNWKPRNVVLSDDTKRFPRRRAPPVSNSANRSSIPGTVPETDERQQVADIVLSMYDGPVPQKSTSTNSFGAAKRVSRPTSPVPTASNSASLSPYWENVRSPRQAPQQRPPNNSNYGRYLNPNDLIEGDYDYLSDHSESSNVSGRNSHHPRYNNNNNNNNNRKKPFGQRGGSSSTNKEKKYSDVVDMQLLEDIPAWLRSLRLHKYNSIFETMKWQDMVKLDDEALTAKGVAALGARRKMLKVFEQIKQHCDKNVSGVFCVTGTFSV
ncbi:hypothetical protein BJV82DRAFT_624651 [Fennellomyces sp. T-0311]|nr:hypothetical protein BJV82DRAFT_624651 [Fennellomyces sp. T-0311]